MISKSRNLEVMLGKLRMTRDPRVLFKMSNVDSECEMKFPAAVRLKSNNEACKENKHINSRCVFVLVPSAALTSKCLYFSTRL